MPVVRIAAATAVLACALAAPVHAQSKAAELKVPVSGNGGTLTLPQRAPYVYDLGLTGTAVGRAIPFGGTAIPVRWQANGVGNTFDPTNFSNGMAFGINDQRQVAAISNDTIYILSTLASTNGGNEQWLARVVKTDALVDSSNQVISGDMNNVGQIIYSSISSDRSLFIDTDGTTTTIDFRNVSLNNHGAFLGADYVGRAEGGVFTTTALPIPETMLRPSARSLNDAGTVVGFAYAGAVSAANSRPFIVDSAGYATLRLPGSSSGGAALGISNAGQAVGWVLDDAGVPDAVLWDQGEPVMLRSIIPANVVAGASSFTAERITDTGYILGLTHYPTPAAGATPPDKYWTILVPRAGTYGRGDANFDAKIDFADLVMLAKNYNKQNASLAVGVGDFDLNGSTSFDDLVTLARNYNTSAASVAAIGGASFAADWSLAQSLVPEPGSLALLAASTMMRRRLRSPLPTGRGSRSSP